MGGGSGRSASIRDTAYVVSVRVGNWGGHARRALLYLRDGAIVDLLAEQQLIGHMVPPRLPLTREVIDHMVAQAPPASAVERRTQYEAMASSGTWSYDPVQNLYVSIPPLPQLPRMDDENPMESGALPTGLALLRLWHRAVAALGDEARARRWAIVPLPALADRTPLEAVLDGDLVQALRVLGPVERGPVL